MPQPDIYQEFQRVFSPVLKETLRWAGFDFIVKDLLHKNKPAIIETGTTRLVDNWEGDGQSTRVWNWLAQKTGCEVFSVDVDAQACKVAAQLCPRVQVCIDDSVLYLRGTLPTNLGLLYLDAYDYKAGVELSSMMHHAAELTAAWDALPSGCLVAIDDCLTIRKGKQAIVGVIFQAIGVQPELESHITIWRKP